MRGRALALLALSAGCVTNWDLRGSGGGHGFSRTITVDGANIAGTAPLIGFPLLVSIQSDPSLRSVEHGGSVLFPNGRDLAFQDAGGVSLPFEREVYDGSAGTLVAWVRLPALVPGVTSVFKLLYGSTAGGASPDPAGLWGPEYRGIWHLAADPSAGSEPDSTALSDSLFAASPVSASQRVPGKIGWALAVDGSDDSFAAASADIPGLSFGVSSSFTFSIWVNAVTTGDYDQPWYAGGAGPYDNGYGTALGTGGWATCVASSAAYVCAQYSAVPLAGSWHQVTAVVDRSAGQLLAYLDGTLTNKASLTGVGPLPAGSNPCIGSADGASFFKGTVDEARVRGGALSAGWIATEFANQSSPSSFELVGPQLPIP